MVHNSIDSFALALDFAAVHLHMRGFHGSLKQERSGLEGCCLA